MRTASAPAPAAPAAKIVRENFLKTGMAALAAGYSISSSTDPVLTTSMLKQSTSPALFAQLVSEGRWVAYPHLRRLNKAIMDTIYGVDGIRRLIVTMPPQHGKSELCSKFLPAWFLGTWPRKRIILASYSDDFAETWSKKARAVLEEWGERLFGIKLSIKTKAGDHWEIDKYGGAMYSAGAMGGVTGKGANLFIIDDPVKNATQMRSPGTRESIWEFFQSAAYTRLQKHGSVILIQTRWHMDDLAGRLLSKMESGGEKWRVINMMAIDDEGRALCPELHPIEELRQTEKTLGPYFWSALYMQRPVPRSGGMFRVDRIEVIPAAPAILARTCRAWDIASTPDDGDFTAGVKMGVDKEGVYYVLDVKRGQWDTDTRDRLILQTAEVDGRHVSIRGPQDPGAAGKDWALAFARKLAGFSVRTEPVSGDKALRADPFSAQVNAGNVKLVSGHWNADFIDELGSFPLGAKDDQVDAAADSFQELSKKRGVYVGRG